MNKHSSSFRVKLLTCFFALFIRFCCSIDAFTDIDLSTQTLNPLTTGYMTTGNAANNFFGCSVSTAGDINGDGYEDIIIGAAYKNSNQGIAYVIYGRKKSSMSNWDFSLGATLDPLTTGFTITGSGSGDYFGISVSTAGDINGDGFDDIMIGAQGRNFGHGAVYVIYGGSKSSMSNWDFSSGTTLTPSTTGFMITGNAMNDNFGNFVTPAGDIDNDGYDDIIVGVPRKNGYKGAIYVIYGRAKSAMTDIDLSSTALDPPTTGFMISGDSSSDSFATTMSTVGDFNNDGYDDIIFSAYQKNGNQGAAYVIYGGDKSLMSDWDFSSGVTFNPLTTGFIITGNAGGDQFGYSVRTAGDINSDGYDDIIVGARRKNSWQGAAYVIYGRAKSAMSNIDLSTQPLNPLTTGFMITGNAINDALGVSVSTAGDLNNDGYDDIIVGANQKNSNRGVAYVIYGGDKSTMTNIALSSTTLDPSSTGFIITGNAANDRFGVIVNTAGDTNDDGYNDIIISAQGKNAVYVIYGVKTNNCPKYCKKCSSLFVCTECKSPYLLYQSECFDSCPAATFKSANTCEDCPPSCSSCTSTSVCTGCKSLYLMYQSECLGSCPVATFESINTCEDCPSPCSSCTSKDVCQACNQGFTLSKNSLCVVPSPETEITGCPSYCSSCTSKGVCQACDQGFTLSNSLCVLSSQGVQKKATQVVSSAARGISSVVCVGRAVSPLAALVSKIVQNTRYLNLSVTSDLSEIYQTWETDLISWDVPNVFANEDHFKASPEMFTRYDASSPFLVNFWPTLMNIGIGLTTFITCFVLQRLCERAKHEGWASSLVQKLKAGSFNFSLVQAHACLDDILFYLVLDAKTNPFNSFFSWASMICAVLFLAFGCLQVFFNFWKVKKYQSIKNQGPKDIEAFNERNKYWELFYSDFSDADLWSQSFLATLIIRSALSSFIITVLYDYPLMQAAYLVIIDLAIISFLYFKTPFNTLRGKLAQYYYETITLLVHICSFVLGLQDTFLNPSDTTKLIFSTGIIYLNTALIGGSLGFMFIEIYETLRLRDKAQKRKENQSIPKEDNQETQKLTQIADHLQASNFINMESSRGLDLNGDHSSELDVFPSHRLNRQRIKVKRPILIQNQQQGNSPIFPSHGVNNEQILDSERFSLNFS